QGFTLQKAPARRSPKALLRLSMTASGKVKVAADKSGRAVELKTENGEPWLRYDHLVATDARGHELPARMEVLGRQISLVVDDANATYPVRIDPTFSQVTELAASDAASGDQFGYSIKISGDTAVVGAYQKNSSTGAAYIFERNKGGVDNWGQVKELTASDAVQGDEFGEKVAINGDTVIVGAPFKNSQTGAAYIFERNQGGADNWGQVKEVTASDAVVSDQFGFAVGINVDTVVIGAENKNLGTGAAYIFERNQGGAESWGQVKELTASDAVQGDQFGNQVTIDGDTVAIGADLKNSSTGAVYIFERNQGGVAENWGQVKELTASDAAQNNLFASELNLNDDTLVVGAPGNNSSTGAAYIFERNQGGAEKWGQVQEVTASDGAQGDLFGVSSAIFGDTVVIGASGH